MRVALGTDDETPVVAFLERHLGEAGHEVIRIPSGEWAEVGGLVGAAVTSGAAEVGVVCCYTGTGVSIAANKVPGVRAALCVDAPTATGARRWNDANVLALSLRLCTTDLAGEIVDAFLAAAADPDTADAIAQLEDPVGAPVPSARGPE